MHDAMHNEGHDMNYASNGSGGAGQIPFSSSGSSSGSPGASGTGAPSKASSLQNYHMLA